MSPSVERGRTRLRRAKGGVLAIGLAAALLGSGCGIGTLGAASAVGGDSTSGDSSTPSLSGFGVSGPEVSPAELRFTLQGPAGGLSTVTLYYQVPGDTLRPLEHLADGADNPMVLATQPTPVEHVFTWAFEQETGLDGGGLVEGVQVWGSVDNGVNTFASGVNGDELALGNDPPELVAPPTIELVQGEASGDVLVRFLARDSSGQSATLQMQFLEEGRPGSDPWRPATLVTNPGSFETNAAEGVEGEVLWDTVSDFGGDDLPTRLRLRLSDDFDDGAWTESAEFVVDNNAVPEVLLDSDALFLSPDQRGGIPIPLDVQDLESDAVLLGIQWRRAGESFPEFSPSTAEQLEDVLGDPIARADLQLCSRLPVEYEGRIARVPVGADPLLSVRLPELAGEASGLLALGLGGQELELLRPSRRLAPVAWSDDLSGVLDAASVGDGRTSLLLIEAGDGWRVEERRLTTGDVVATFDLTPFLSNDEPIRLALGPEQRYLFVASAEDTRVWLYRFDRAASNRLTGSAVYDDGVPKKVRQLTAVTSQTVLVTTSQQLLAFFYAGSDFLLPVAKGDELRDSWGVAPDPSDQGRAYVSTPNAGDGEPALHRVTVETLDTEPVPLVHVDAADPGASIALRALAVEQDTGRLLAVAQTGAGPAELRVIAAGQRAEEAGISGAPTARVPSDLSDPLARLATGPDGLRLSVDGGSDPLRIGGGLQERRTLVPAPSGPSDPLPYDPAGQLVTLAEPLAVPPDPGQPWRLRIAQERVPTSPDGTRSIFLWDSADVPQAGSVFLRPLAADNDPGPFSPFEAPKELSSSFRDEVHSLGGGGLPPVVDRDLLAADLDGDGDLDLVVTEGDRVVQYRQVTAGAFAPSPEVVISGSEFEPREIAAADFTNDGLVDLAVVNGALGRVEVHEQQVSGEFALGDVLTPSAEGVLRGLHVLQLNEDFFEERLDIVVINETRAQLEVFTQSVLGGFGQPAVPIGLGSGFSATSVFGARVDIGSDTVDLVTKSAEGELFLHYQNTNGSFDGFDASGDPHVITGLSGISPRLIALDLGADNLIDIVSTSTDFDGLHVVRQLQSGEFSGDLEALGGPGVSDDPSDVRSADVNGDGRIDVLCTNETGNSVSIFFQRPDGSVDPIPLVIGDVATSNSPTALVARDLDGDGRTDLAAASRFGSHLAVHLQQPPGSFESAPDDLIVAGLLTSQGGDPVAVASGDLNGDGLDDIACATSAGLLHVFWQANPGRYESQPTRLAAEAQGYRDVAIRDVDGDGLADLLAGRLDPEGEDPGSVELYLQRAGVGFESGRQPDARLLGFGGERVGTLSVDDFDLDGRLDVAAAADPLAVFLQPAGGFSGDLAPTTTLGRAARLVRNGDLDRDGRPDLVDLDAGELRLRFGADPPGTWHPPTLLALPAGVEARSLQLADLDQNGWLDLVVLGGANGQIWCYAQIGPRRFEPTPAPLRPRGELQDPQDLAIADVDGDALPDLLVADRGTSEVVLFRATLPGVYLSPGERRGGPGITAGCAAVHVADLDGDGAPDLLTANPGAYLGASVDTLSLFWGGH